MNENFFIFHPESCILNPASETIWISRINIVLLQPFKILNIHFNKKVSVFL